MDDLLDLLEANEAQLNNNESSSVTRSCGDQQTKKNVRKLSELPPEDSILDVRMVQRVMPSVDLIQLTRDPSFLTLAEYVVKTGDDSSYTTLGIVWSVQAARVSQAGNAFGKCRLGTLATGPCLDVLLFGSACTQLKLKVGQVVALHHAQHKEDGANIAKNKSLLTVSVGDARQVELVAHRALDLGRCAARVRGKNDQGVWKADAKACPHLIDTRKGKYCAQHRHSDPGQKKNAAATLQQLRAQPHQRIVPKPEATLARPSQPRPCVMSNSLFDSSRVTMAATQCLLPTQPTARQPAAAAPARRPQQPMVPRTVAPPATRKVSGDWLHQAVSGMKTAKSTKNAANKRRRVNTDPAVHMEGSVMVPQPLQRSTNKRLVPREAPHRQPQLPTAAILESQKTVAEKMMKQPKQAPLVSRKKKSKNAPHALFDTLGDFDAATVRNQRSKLARAAQAKDMVVALQRVQELECQEVKSDKEKKNKNQRRLNKQWYCQDCRQPFCKLPEACQRAGHRVVVQRQLASAPVSKDEHRLLLNDKKELTLGQGLEWSRWNRFS